MLTLWGMGVAFCAKYSITLALAVAPSADVNLVASTLVILACDMSRVNSDPGRWECKRFVEVTGQPSCRRRACACVHTKTDLQ